MEKKLFFLLLLFSLQCYAQKKIYISSAGNNHNNGVSAITPVKGLGELEYGTTYLLRRKDTFYFAIKKSDANTGHSKITIGAYGKGPKPVICLYKKIKPKAWTHYHNNIWRLDLKDTRNFNGFLDTNNTNVGFIKADGNIYGNKLDSLQSLHNQWDFFSDNRFLYVSSSIIPSDVASSIDVTTDFCIIQLSENMVIRDLNLIGTGGHAIQGAKIRNVQIKNIDINEIGGSYLRGFKNGTTRYGNGIEFGSGSANCEVLGCRVRNVYDAAFTMQGGGNINFENIHFRNNYCSANEQSFEFWIKGGQSGFKNCSFENNTCEDAGYGWSHFVRPDKEVGVHILNYYWEVSSTDLTIRHNQFRNAVSGFLYIHNYKKNEISYFKSYENAVYLRPNTPLIPSFRNSKAVVDKSTLNVMGLEHNTQFHNL